MSKGTKAADAGDDTVYCVSPPSPSQSVTNREKHRYCMSWAVSFAGLTENCLKITHQRSGGS